MSKLNVDLFEKSINGLNKNLSVLGGIFRVNITILATDATEETKKNAVNKIADSVEKLLDAFRENYADYNQFYEELKENVKNNTMDDEVDYKVFLEHADQVFPRYIDELGQSIDSMTNIEVRTEKFDNTMRELGSIIENIRFDFKRTLSVVDFYNIQKDKNSNEN
ncbi:MAG: hypothetical protein MJ232_02500 [archaeon]|nr:hypothetical protein [archaeon]